MAIFLPRVGAVYICEAPQFLEPYFVTGTPDLVAEVDGQTVVADWKSFVPKPTEDGGTHGPKVRADWIYQNSAYVTAVELYHGIKIQRGINCMVSDQLIRDKFWRREQIDEAAEKFKIAAKDYLVIQSRLGCVGSSVTLRRHHYGNSTR